MESMECLNDRGCVEEERIMTLSVATSRVETIKSLLAELATSTRLLNIMYRFYGFSGDLIETIN